MDEKKLEEIFWQKIEAEEKIEPKDWMPADYRKNLIRQISIKSIKINDLNI